MTFTLIKRNVRSWESTSEDGCDPSSPVVEAHNAADINFKDSSHQRAVTQTKPKSMLSGFWTLFVGLIFQAYVHAVCS